MRYIGLDVHWRQSTICVLDSRGKKLSNQTIHGHWSKVLKELGKTRKPFSVCFEASLGYGFLFERLVTIAQHVVVAHPGQLRLIFRSKRKNDRVDAEKLAKLLFLDEVPPVYVPSCDVRSWRSMIKRVERVLNQKVANHPGVELLRTIPGVGPRTGWAISPARGWPWSAVYS